MKSEPTTPYSYHTFIFPFLFESGGHCTRSKFTSCLPPLGKGRYEDTVKSDVLPDKALYDQYRYFNQAARNAIFTSHFNHSAIVWNYRYDIELMACGEYTGAWRESRKTVDNPARIAIDKNAIGFHANLAVNGVRLKLFNTGVGMLVFELENYTLSSETDINRINEFGRRVFMPFIKSEEDRTCSLCADRISLFYGDTEILEASGKISGMESSRADEIKLASIVHYFLSNSEKRVTTSPNPKANEFYIEPIIDDRMFVACICNNKDLVNDLKQWNDQERAYTYLVHAETLRPDAKDNLARRLYELMFVDGDGITCLNRTMLKESLEKHLYTRWTEYSTITGITEYSMITVTSGIEFLSLPFLAEYIEIMILVLAQRASLLAFERAISQIACNKTKLDVETVQKKYVMFQSELLLQEVTAQQQGIELYNMLLDNLFINQQQVGIEAQIKSLFDLNSASNEKSENWILFILAVLGISEAAQIIVGEWLELKEYCLHVSLSAFVGILLWKWLRKKNWKK